VPGFDIGSHASSHHVRDAEVVLVAFEVDQTNSGARLVGSKNAIGIGMSMPLFLVEMPSLDSQNPLAHARRRAGCPVASAY